MSSEGLPSLYGIFPLATVNGIKERSMNIIVFMAGTGEIGMEFGSVVN